MIRGKTFAGIALLLMLAACDNSTPPDASKLAGAQQCLNLIGGIDLQKSSVPEIQQALSSGRLSSENLVALYLQRIALFDSAGPTLNSIRTLAPDALAQAVAADAARSAGRKSLLDGIPVLLKDNIGTTDMPTTAGSIALALNIPKAEAHITKRLRDAGAIVLGKTNLSEFANWVDLDMPNGYSSLGGQVIAPYRFDMDPLGSSTGSGVAGTMAFATVAIGTETSGSIISPALVHSLVGVKPTLGLVSRAGIIPLAPGFDTAGPMTRSVTDAAILLGVIAGVDPNDSATQRLQEKFGGKVPDYLAALSDTALQGARLGVRDGVLDNDATQPGVFAAALEILRQQGAEIVVIEEPLPLASNVSLAELGAIPNEFKFSLNRYLADQAGPAVPVHTLTEIIAFNEQHPEQVKYGQRLLQASDAQSGLELDPPSVVARETAQRGAQAWINTVMQQHQLDAIIGADFSNISVTAAAGYPNVTVPMGYENGTPRGITFSASAFAEERLLAFAYDFEQASSVRRSPFQKNSVLRKFCPPE